VAELRRRVELNSYEIARIESQARAADLQAHELARRALAASPASTGLGSSAGPVLAANGTRSLQVVVTGYALPGRTATGIPVGWGVVAVDPSVIPLGTHMVIPGYGEAVAADTGGTVVGTTIDVWFPTAAQAAAWGRRSVTITLH
jgi:3D (Asp-Asp-Asp) domain-containing protein